jgi:hypothetical protein
MNVSPNCITSSGDKPPQFARLSQQKVPWDNTRNDISDLLDDTDSSGCDPDKRVAQLYVATTASLCSHAGLTFYFVSTFLVCEACKTK